MRKRIIFAAVLILALALTIGCGVLPSGKKAPEATQAPATKEVSVKETPAPTEAPPTKEAAGAKTGEEGQELDLEKYFAELDKLNSYKAKLTMRAEGTDKDGNPVKWSLEMSEIVVKNPPAQEVTMTSSGQEAPLSFIRIGDQQYILMGEGTCMSTTEKEAPETFISPEDFATELTDARLVGTETVNGIKAKHYVYVGESLPIPMFIKEVKEDIWIATEGYVVKMIVEAKIEDVDVGTGTIAKGTVHWAYELLDVNKPFKIEVPESCKASVPEDIVMLPDAADVSSMMGMTTYNSETSFDEAVNFYKTEMAAKGWKLADSTEMEGMAMLSFTKGDRNVQVTIQSQDGGVSVMIMTQQ